MWPQRILSSALSRRAKLVFESPARIRCFYISTPSDTSSRLTKGELPDFDERTGRIKANGYKVTALGKLLLRLIDQNCANSQQTATVPEEENR
jgi:hypothetical protein